MRASTQTTILGLAVLAFSIALLWVTLGFAGEPRDRLFPQIILFLMAAVGIALMWKGASTRTIDERIAPALTARVRTWGAIALFPVCFAYPFLAYHIGFYATAFVFMSLVPLAAIWVQEPRNRTKPLRKLLIATLSSALFIAVLYLCFWIVLRLPLPSGILI